MIGTIEKISFTNGSFGEQYVTIDGVTYMTFWDITELKKGRAVEIETSPPRNCYVGNAKVVFENLEAKFVRFVEESSSRSE